MSDGEFQIPDEFYLKALIAFENTPEGREMEDDLIKYGRQVKMTPEEIKDFNGLKQEKMTGIDLISQERLEQKIKHGHTIQRDFEENTGGELVQAAQALLEGDINWMPESWDIDICKKLISKPFKERLVIAGAFIAAEIDRAEFEKVQNKKHD